jgi:hypothetical protein
MEKMRNICRIFVIKPLGKWPLVKLTRRFKGNIKVDQREIDQEDGKWPEIIGMASSSRLLAVMLNLGFYYQNINYTDSIP